MKQTLFFLLVFFISTTKITTANALPTEFQPLQEKFAQMCTQISGSYISLTSENDFFSCSSPNVDEDSQYYIASVSKQMTAYMLLKTLHRQHPDESLEDLLNQPLNTVFPHSKLLKEIDRDWISKITLLDLLTHRSGLPDFVDYYKNVIHKGTLLNQPIDPIVILQSITFNPVKQYDYANTNYFLIAKLLEEIREETFDKIFNKLIKHPARMKHSYAPITGNYFELSQEYRLKKLLPDLNQDIFMNMSNILGAGNIISTNKDLIKWNHYLYSEKNNEIRNIILKKYDQIDGDFINLGLDTSETNLGEVPNFNGTLDSYRSFLAYFTEYKVTLVILSNNPDDFIVPYYAFWNLVKPPALIHYE